MKKFVIVLCLIAAAFAAAIAQAAPAQQAEEGEVYVVQANDWLSKLADKFYGDIFAYPTIVEATNAKAAEDSSFARIDNPDVIEVGQKLWIPAATPAATTPSEPTTEAATSTPETPVQAATTVTQTEVINYLPQVPATSQDGTCWTHSIAVGGSLYAWRCMVGNAIYDPCLTAVDGKTIVCGVPDEEFAMNLTEPLPDEDVADFPVRAWHIELEGGIICGPFTGTLPPVEETVHYGCTDESIIVGDLQQDGAVWYATIGTLEPNDEGPLPFKVSNQTQVAVVKVWLAGDPSQQ